MQSASLRTDFEGIAFGIARKFSKKKAEPNTRLPRPQSGAPVSAGFVRVLLSDRPHR